MKVLVLPFVKNFSKIADNFSEVEFFKALFKHITIRIVDSKPSVFYKNEDLTSFDFIWLSSWWKRRDLAYALSLYLEENGINHTSVEESGSKIVDHMALSLKGLSSPNTFFVGTNNAKSHISEIESVCNGYPLIIKETRGSRGRNTFLVKSREELENRISLFKSNVQYMFQQFIENDYDWGVIVLNGKAVSAEKSYRQEKDEFRNHAFRGAQEIHVPLHKCPQEIKDMAENAANTLGLDWCRADIIVEKTTERPSLLEVNRSPGITPNTNEEKAVISYLDGLLGKEDEKLNGLINPEVSY